MRPGFFLIHATGSEPAWTQVPTSSCSITAGLVFCGDRFDRPLAVDGRKFQLVVVVAGLQPGGRQQFRAGIQQIGYGVPAVRPVGGLGAGHYHVLAAENGVERAGVLDLFTRDVGTVVVRRVAADAEIVHQLAHVFGLRLGPLKVGRKEFDALVAHLRHGLDRALGILLERVAHGVEFDAQRDFRRGRKSRAQRERSRSRQREKGTA